ncbi:uncharacterized protein [Cicer arietinum]|uniref:Uncharacterized protein LOC105852725 n=1 Tax=Cicer arietinum TaxID=3827 RepID=A0A1S3EHC2_CICAR|nr:uncharacterized protein LOC105852725 [Cicer arietinum]
MGNNLKGINRLDNINFPSYHEQLGSNGAIDVTKIEHKVMNGHTGELFDIVKWNLSYTIDKSKCILDLRRISNKEGKIDSVSFQLSDDSGDMYSDGNIWFVIAKDSDFLASTSPAFVLNGGFKNCRQKNKKTFYASSYVMETCAYLYGSGSKVGFLVVEEKRKSGDNEKPCKVTIAHYYAISSGNIFSQNKIDIGLSMVVRIQPSNEIGLDITIEGPIQHPSAALHYMFHEVMKTGIWKPTICPHCASIKRKESDELLESEEDSEEDFPPQGFYGPKLNFGSIIANGGAVRGNNNGNLIVKKLFLRR